MSGIYSSRGNRYSAALPEASLWEMVKAGTVGGVQSGTEFFIERAFYRQLAANQLRPICPDGYIMDDGNFYRPYIAAGSKIIFYADDTDDSGPGGVVAAGAGMQSVDAYLADFAGTWTHETVVLDGPNDVETSGSYNALVFHTGAMWGANNRNTGPVTAWAKDVTNDLMGQIVPQYNRNTNAWFWVPSGYEFEIESQSFNCGTGSVSIYLFEYDVATGIEYRRQLLVPITQGMKGGLPRVKIPGGRFIIWAGEHSSITLDVSGQISGFLRKL